MNSEKVRHTSSKTVHVFGYITFQSTWVCPCIFNCLSGIHVVQITWVHVFSSMLWYVYFYFRVKRCLVRSSICFVGGSCFIYMLIVFIYAYWCPTRYLYQMMFVLFNSNTVGATWGAETANPSRVPEFTPSFQWGSCCSIYRLLCNVL